MTQVTTPTIQTWVPKPQFKNLDVLRVPTNQDGANGTIRVRGPDNHERPMARKALDAFYQLEDQPLPEAA